MDIKLWVHLSASVCFQGNLWQTWCVQPWLHAQSQKPHQCAYWSPTSASTTQSSTLTPGPSSWGMHWKGLRNKTNSGRTGDKLVVMDLSNTNSNLSLSYSAHKSLKANHNISTAQLFHTHTTKTHTHTIIHNMSTEPQCRNIIRILCVCVCVWNKCAIRCYSCGNAFKQAQFVVLYESWN